MGFIHETEIKFVSGSLVIPGLLNRFAPLICPCRRWSKIAKHLPGRTDNEIKNYWRTRIQKHIRQTENNQGQSSEPIDQASTSHVSSSHADPMEAYSPPSYQVKLEIDHNAAALPLIDSNDNYWSMEDFWSMQLLNGD